MYSMGGDGLDYRRGGSGVRLGEELASVLRARRCLVASEKLASVLRARRCLVASEMTGLWSYVLLICFLCLWHLASEGLWL